MEKELIRVGVDIGGTNTAWGIVDSNDKFLSEGTFLTSPNQGNDSFVRKLVKIINAETAKLSDSYRLEGVGFAAPGANFLTGIIESAVNLGWGRINFIDEMKKHLDVPMVILNDANAAALGEQAFGAARGMKNFIILTLGTGMGSGIVANGQLLIGHEGLAGEIGHSVIELNGRKCHCGKSGCLETYISATGLKRTVFSLLCDLDVESELRKIDFNSLTSLKIGELARKNDPIAAKAFDYTGMVLGRALANMVTYFNPEAIILFGGLADAGEILMKPAGKYFEDYVLDIYKGKVKILKSNLQDGRAAVLGACSFIRYEINSKKVA